MDFEWDQAKSDTNLRERGFGFDFAALVFAGPVLEFLDDRKDYREVRVQAIGAVDDIILSVIYTDRGPVRRIISARIANRGERRLWQLFARA